MEQKASPINEMPERWTDPRVTVLAREFLLHLPNLFGALATPQEFELSIDGRTIWFRAIGHPSNLLHYVVLSHEHHQQLVMDIAAAFGIDLTLKDVEGITISAAPNFHGLSNGAVELTVRKRLRAGLATAFLAVLHEHGDEIRKASSGNYTLVGYRGGTAQDNATPDER